MRFAPKHRRDNNHQAIARRLEELGCSVQDTSQVGGSFWDLVVGILGHDYGVEVKDIGNQLSEDQAEFHRDWRGQKPVVIWTEEQAEKWVMEVRRRIWDEQ